MSTSVQFVEGVALSQPFAAPNGASFGVDVLSHAPSCGPTPPLNAERVTLIPPRPQIGSYLEVTRRIPQADKEKIGAYFTGHSSELRKAAIELDALFKTGSLKAIQQRINSPQGLHKDFLIALFGLKEGLVSFSVFCRIGDLLPIAEKEKVVLDCYDPMLVRALYENLIPYLPEELVWQYIERFPQLPQEERIVFAHLTDKGTLTDLFDPQVPLSEILDQKQGFNVLDCLHSTHGRTLFSNEAFEWFLQTKFLDHAVKLNPVCALSSGADIRLNGLTQTRDVAMSYVVPELDGLRLVMQGEADGYCTPETEFQRHDWYHCFVCSAIPHEWRVHINALADEVRLSGVKGITRLLRDMDMPEFYADTVQRGSGPEQWLEEGKLLNETPTYAYYFLGAVFYTIFICYVSEALCEYSAQNSRSQGASEQTIEHATRRTKTATPPLGSDGASAVLSVFQHYLGSIKTPEFREGCRQYQVFSNNLLKKQKNILESYSIKGIERTYLQRSIEMQDKILDVVDALAKM